MIKWYDEKNEAVVVLIRLPAEVSEAVTANDDGTYTVVINEDKPDDVRMRAYRHAIGHIRRGDFWSPRPAGEIESEASA